MQAAVDGSVTDIAAMAQSAQRCRILSRTEQNDQAGVRREQVSIAARTMGYTTMLVLPVLELRALGGYIDSENGTSHLHWTRIKLS